LPKFQVLTDSLRAILLKARHPTWSQQFEALSAYRGLTLQAYLQKPFSPQVSPLIWGKDDFYLEGSLPLGAMPASRERSYSAHFYGHDIVIKRFAGLPLVGPYLPYTIEHGLKLSPLSYFEKPNVLSSGFLCMSQERSDSLDKMFKTNSVAIGPWIHYAKPVLDKNAMHELKIQLGKTLLVIGSHNWGEVTRHYDQDKFIDRIQIVKEEYEYQTVIHSLHWMDDPNGFPSSWISACHGHKLNPWFLDCLKTLFMLSDGLATNSIGTHLGYSISERKQVHWMPIEVRQNISSLSGHHLESEKAEWRARTSFREMLDCLSDQGQKPLTASDHSLHEEINKYWGLDSLRSANCMRDILTMSKARD
jgi:hypothetical protein